MKRRQRTPAVLESASNLKILHKVNKGGLFHILFGLIKFSEWCHYSHIHQNIMYQELGWTALSTRRKELKLTMLHKNFKVKGLGAKQFQIKT